MKILQCIYKHHRNCLCLSYNFKNPLADEIINGKEVKSNSHYLFNTFLDYGMNKGHIISKPAGIGLSDSGKKFFNRRKLFFHSIYVAKETPKATLKLIKGAIALFK